MRGSVSLSSEPPYQEQLETKIEDLRQQVAELTLSSDTYFTERNSARDAWRRVSKERDQLRRQLTTLKNEIRLIGEAIDDPRTDLTMTMSEVILELRQQLAATERSETLVEIYVDPDANKTPEQLRVEGRAYCPKCYTFGDSHRKNCPYRNEGMSKHVKEPKP